MSQRSGRGGRKGQTHTATPRLRSYTISPASEVTVTGADGTTSVAPARKPKDDGQQRSRRRGPLVCAICGDPAGEGPTFYSNAPRTRGKPVHDTCDPSARRRRPKRPPKPRGPEPAPPVRGSVPPDADPETAWRALSCPQCSADPGQLCVYRYSDDTSGESERPHRERTAAVRKALRPR